MEDFKALFNKMTGLDYDTMTEEEYNEWYHQRLIEISEKEPYTKEILKSAELIIEGKDYPQLTKILENYDKLVKDYLLKRDDMNEYPYWMYGFGSSGQE